MTMLTAKEIRDEKAQRRAAHPIEVMNRGELVARYGREWDPGDVIKDLLESYPDESYAGLDLAVWRNGYLIAAIVQGRDGRPELTRFSWQW